MVAASSAMAQPTERPARGRADRDVSRRSGVCRTCMANHWVTWPGRTHDGAMVVAVRLPSPLARSPSPQLCPAGPVRARASRTGSIVVGGGVYYSIRIAIHVDVRCHEHAPGRRSRHAYGAARERQQEVVVVPRTRGGFPCRPWSFGGIDRRAAGRLRSVSEA